MADTQLTTALTAEETVLLVEGWLKTSPRLTFKQVRADARNLNLSISPRQYGEAKRRLGITGAPPRPAPAKSPPPRGTPMNRPVVAKTPLMSFLVEFLRNKPDATYHEVKTAGGAAGFRIAPINFGNARSMLGLSAERPPRKPPQSRRVRQDEEPGASGATPSGRRSAGLGRRGRKGKLDLGNLSNLVSELQEVIAERDRLLQALDRIADVIRSI